MPDLALVPAIREAIKQNEIGNASPYRLAYACFGASGASFGVFQGDTNVNETARETLVRALQASGAAPEAIARIMAAVSQRCPNGNPLSQADSMTTDAALSSDEGRTLVDEMDAGLLRVVLNELDSCIAAAARRNHTIEPGALLYIALWVNMTGAPDILSKWLAGTQEVGLAPPVGPVVVRQDVESYLEATTYFRLHPRNFVHIQESVKAALPLLPSA